MPVPDRDASMLTTKETVATEDEELSSVREAKDDDLSTT